MSKRCVQVLGLEPQKFMSQVGKLNAWEKTPKKLVNNNKQVASVYFGKFMVFMYLIITHMYLYTHAYIIIVIVAADKRKMDAGTVPTILFGDAGKRASTGNYN